MSDISLSKHQLKKLKTFELSTNKDISKMSNKEKLNLYNKIEYIEYKYNFTGLFYLFYIIFLCGLIASLFFNVLFSIFFAIMIGLLYLNMICVNLSKNSIANEINNLHNIKKTKPCE